MSKSAVAVSHWHTECDLFSTEILQPLIYWAMHEHFLWHRSTFPRSRTHYLTKFTIGTQLYKLTLRLYWSRTSEGEFIIIIIPIKFIIVKELYTEHRYLAGSVQRSRRPDDIVLIEKWLYVRPPNVPFNVHKTCEITVGTHATWDLNETKHSCRNVY